jgi:hypothetical protein
MRTTFFGPRDGAPSLRHRTAWRLLFRTQLKRKKDALRENRYRLRIVTVIATAAAGALIDVKSLPRTFEPQLMRIKAMHRAPRTIPSSR